MTFHCLDAARDSRLPTLFFLQKLLGFMHKSDPDFQGCDNYIDFLDSLLGVLRKSSTWADEESKLKDALRTTYGLPAVPAAACSPLNDINMTVLNCRTS